MLLPVFSRRAFVFLLEAAGKIGVVVKSRAFVDLADGEIGKRQQILGVGEADIVQIGLEIHSQLLGKAIRKVRLGESQMIGGAF